MDLAQELRFSARMLAKNKGWTTVAALALALGLGANVAIFSVVGLMIWTPLPYPHPEQLVYIPQTSQERGFSRAAVSWKDIQDWAPAPGIASTAAWRSRPVSVSDQGEPQSISAMRVTPGFFPILGIAPARGRVFTPSESPETDSRVAVISDGLWRTRYGSDPGILGRQIRLDGANYTIVGVMPATFHVMYQRIDIWMPLSLAANERERGYRALNCLARLKPGVSVDRASAQIRSISERIEREDPQNGKGWRGVVRPLSDRLIGRGGRAAASTMFGAVGFVLLIACANVASLLLARGSLRRREFALRASLGASRGALIRMQLVESVLLSVVGGAAGILSAVWTIPLLKRVAPSDMMFFQMARLDWHALEFGLALSLLTGVLFGLIPAWLLTKGDLAPKLQEASRGSTGGRHVVLKALVAGEMALALVLVAATTLMVRSLIRQSTLDPGFETSNLTTAAVLLPPARYPEKTQIVNFYSRVLANLRREGSLESAALAQTIPLSGDNSYTSVFPEGSANPAADSVAGSMIVSPGYFQTMGIPLLAGRDFTDADNADAPTVAIVNQTFAKRYWPKESNPVGRRLRIGTGQSPWITVVGLARDVRHSDVLEPPRPEVYRPHAQTAALIMMIAARTRGSDTAAGALRTAVLQVDPDQPLYRLQSLESLLYEERSGARATAQVLGFLAAIAMVLAAVGAYGVMSYAAAQRAREIGIRLALGASGSKVFRMVLGGGLAVAAIGLGVGLPAAYGVAPLLRTIDSGVQAGDVATYAGVTALLFGAALVACAIPAWRAMRADPATVLREE